MDRTANATILGFNYQFNKSILDILKADDDKTQIMLEGTKEDLDIFLPDKTIAVQCKYYESTENLTPSVLAKPILDMLLSYMEDKTLNYKLYIHYKNSSIEKKEEFNNTIFTEILKTKNKSYIKKYFPFIYNFDDSINKLFYKKELESNDIKIIHEYIEKQGNKILKINIDDFINRIEIFSAPSYDSLFNEIIQKIISDGHNEDDAINLFYPNFFHKVATISANEDKKERIIECWAFKNKVYELKELLSTKWLKSIYSFEKYKKIIKNNLRIRLQNNSSVRVIYFDISKYSNSEVASFIVDYIAKYNKKPQLNKCPIFIIEDKNYDKFLEIQMILYNNYKVSFENGDVARKFNLDKFINADGCSLKICLRCKEIDDYLITNIPNDVFAIGDIYVEKLEETGIACTKMQGLTMDDVKEVFYLGGKNERNR